MAWNKDNWGVHPDYELQTLYRSKPYQGCDPKKADILVIGKDANFPEHLSSKEKGLIYLFLSDPNLFWKLYPRIFHPFQIKGLFNNQRYYNKIGIPALTDNHNCKKICAVDLLSFPTYGSSGNSHLYKYHLGISEKHTQWLN